MKEKSQAFTIAENVVACLLWKSIFCEKKSKYLKGTRNRGPLVQCRDLRADRSIRKSAREKKGSPILTIASCEIVAAEACYHRTCYKNYTKAEASPTVASDGCGESLEDKYVNLESVAFDYIRSDVLCKREISQIDWNDRITCIVSHVFGCWCYSQRSTSDGISRQNLAMPALKSCLKPPVSS